MAPGSVGPGPVEHAGDPDKHIGSGKPVQELGLLGYPTGGAGIVGDRGGRETSWGEKKKRKMGMINAVSDHRKFIYLRRALSITQQDACLRVRILIPVHSSTCMDYTEHEAFYRVKSATSSPSQVSSSRNNRDG